MNPLPYPVGQKVVCVDANFPSAVFEAFDEVPQQDQVYTVQEMFWGVEHGSGRSVLSVRLTELPPIKKGWGGFSLWRFRLLEDVKVMRRREREARTVEAWLN